MAASVVRQTSAWIAADSTRTRLLRCHATTPAFERFCSTRQHGVQELTRVWRSRITPFASTVPRPKVCGHGAATRNQHTIPAPLHHFAGGPASFPHDGAIVAVLMTDSGQLESRGSRPVIAACKCCNRRFATRISTDNDTALTTRGLAKHLVVLDTASIVDVYR
jgi:hypothetical protein